MRQFFPDSIPVARGGRNGMERLLCQYYGAETAGPGGQADELYNSCLSGDSDWTKTVVTLIASLLPSWTNTPLAIRWLPEKSCSGSSTSASIGSRDPSLSDIRLVSTVTLTCSDWSGKGSIFCCSAWLVVLADASGASRSAISSFVRSGFMYSVTVLRLSQILQIFFLYFFKQGSALEI